MHIDILSIIASIIKSKHDYALQTEMKFSKVI